MTCEQLDGQMAMFDVVGSSGRTSPEPLVREPQRERTSPPSSKRSSKSSSRKQPLCLCLKRDGQTPGAYTTSWVDGQWHIALSMPNGGELRSDAAASRWWLTSTDSSLQAYCLTLNLSERPRVANPSKLSEILEPMPDPKYNLSSRACQGILNRAAKRGKELPKALKDALEFQAAMEPSASRNEPGNQGG